MQLEGGVGIGKTLGGRLRVWVDLMHVLNHIVYSFASQAEGRGHGAVVAGGRQGCEVGTLAMYVSTYLPTYLHHGAFPGPGTSPCTCTQHGETGQAGKTGVRSSVAARVRWHGTSRLAAPSQRVLARKQAAGGEGSPPRQGLGAVGVATATVTWCMFTRLSRIEQRPTACGSIMSCHGP